MYKDSFLYEILKTNIKSNKLHEFYKVSPRITCLAKDTLSDINYLRSDPVNMLQLLNQEVSELIITMVPYY